MIDDIGLLQLFRDEMPGPSTDAWARARSAIAAARSEEEPPCPRRHPGRGRPRLFSIAGVAVAAAAVGALLAVLLPTSPVTRAPSAASAQHLQETAYVVSRVGQALSGPAQRNAVQYARTVLPSGVITPVPTGLRLQIRTGAGSGLAASSVVSWSHQGTDKFSAFTATGQRVVDVRNTPAAGGGGMTVAVIYSDATWWRAVTAPGPLGRPRCGGGNVIIGHGGWPTFIRHELGCGGYTTAGRQRVDGINAIKIAGGKGLAVLWVDPATYLPVRALLAIGNQRPQTDFRWLPITPASLAQLRVPVPAGFRQVPPPL